MRPVALLLTSLTSAALLSGCGPSADDIRARRIEALRKDLETQLERVERNLAGTPERLHENTVSLRAIELQAGDDLPELASRATSLASQAKKGFDDAAAAAGKELETKVNDGLAKLPEADDVDQTVRELERAIDTFPDAYLPANAQLVEDLRRKILTERAVADRGGELLAKVDRMCEMGFADQALGIIDAFEAIPEYRDSSYASIMTSKRKEVTAKVAEAEKEAAEEAKVPWAEIIAGGEGLMNFVVEGSSVFLPKTNYVEADNDTGGNATLRTGDPSWSDLVIELEFNIIKKGFQLALRLEGNNYDLIPCTDSEYPRLEWQEVRIRLKGDKARVTSLTTFQSSDHTLQNAQGRIGLVFEDGSKVRIRKLRIRNLKAE